MINIKIACSKVLFHFFERLQRSCEHCFSRFIVTARRGNDIFAVLSSSRSAETISLPFYRHRAAREQYFRVSVLAALLRALKFLFSPLQNGGTCWNGRGGACVPARTSAQRRFHTKYTRMMHGEFNDGCALTGRHGRAHRHRPYPSPSNHAECPYLITLYIRQPTPTARCVHTPTVLHIR